MRILIIALNLFAGFGALGAGVGNLHNKKLWSAIILLTLSGANFISAITLSSGVL